MISLTIEQTSSAALSLNVSERARLAHMLLVSLDETDEIDFADELDCALSRRVSEIESGRAKSRPLAEVAEAIRAHYR